MLIQASMHVPPPESWGGPGIEVLNFGGGGVDPEALQTDRSA